MSLMDGVLGLRGWRWLFLIDGAPAILLGLFAMWVLTDRPERARFLSDAEKQVVAEDMEADRRARTSTVSTTVAETIRDPKVWLMVLAFFCMPLLNTNNIWFPTLLKTVAGLLQASAGDIRMAGASVASSGRVSIVRAAYVRIACDRWMAGIMVWSWLVRITTT